MSNVLETNHSFLNGIFRCCNICEFILQVVYSYINNVYQICKSCFKLENWIQNIKLKMVLSQRSLHFRQHPTPLTEVITSE